VHRAIGDDQSDAC
jgi:hypothetical protein